MGKRPRDFQMDRRVFADQFVEVRFGNDQQFPARQSAYRGGARAIFDQRHLPEEVTGPAQRRHHFRTRGAFPNDLHPAVFDDVERFRRIAAAENDVVRLGFQDGHQLRKPLQFLELEPVEEMNAPQ